MSSRSEQLFPGGEDLRFPARPSWVVPVFLIFVGYFLTAALGSAWSLITHAPPAIWPAAGIAIAGLAVTRLRYWPAVVLAMIAAFQVTNNVHSLPAQLLLALSKAAAAVVGALVLRKTSSAGELRLRQFRDLGGLLVAGCAAALVSAGIGSAVFLSEGQVTADRLLPFVTTWFLSDVLGTLVFGGLVLSWRQFRGIGWSAKDWANFVATLLVLGFVTWLIYFGQPRSAAFYLYPILVWAAFNLRTAGATAALALMSLIAVAGTSLDLGPFAQETGGADIMRMQQYIAIAALMTLFVAAVSEERRDRAITDTQRAESLAASRLAELTSLYESAPIGLAFFDREYRYLRINDELASINGLARDAHIGRTIGDVLPVNAPYVEPVIDRIFATGEAVRDLEVTGETPQQPGVTRHWLTGFYPLKNADGEVDAVGAWVVEISERKRAEERETLLAREVDHRAKNLLAVVQSVVQLTHARDTDELKAGIVGRIQSLARAHSLLADSRWDGAQLDDLVREELAPYLGEAASRVSIEGAQLLLRPAAAQSLAMVLHELATNAAKYGALANPKGRLQVKWTRTKDRLEIRWAERGVSGVKTPRTSGFGSKIMRASIERQLHGELTQEWKRDGLRCTIRVSPGEVLVGVD